MAAVQQEVKLVQKDVAGNTVPYCCIDCGKQMVGVKLNILTFVVLDCTCKPLLHSCEVQSKALTEEAREKRRESVRKSWELRRQKFGSSGGAGRRR